MPQIVVKLPEGARLRRDDTGEVVVTLQKALLAVGGGRKRELSRVKLDDVAQEQQPCGR
jgi:hypothetical protein